MFSNSFSLPEELPPGPSIGLLAAIVKSSRDAIISIELDGTIASWNTAAEQIFGYSAAEAIGEKICMIFPPDTREEQRGIKARLHAGENIPRYQTVCIGKDGQEIYINNTLSPLYDSTGKIVGTSMIAQDITEQKMMERNLQTYLKELEDSNQDLRTFSHLASHDLKEPLRSLSLLSSILMEDYKDKLDAAGVKLLHRLVALCNRMDRLINNLLYFAELENAKSAIQETDLNEIIKEIKQMMEVSIKEKNASILIPSPLPLITCDRIRITEVFRNLITNAVNYNDKEKALIEVGFVKELKTENGNEKNVFYVKDNGVGIEPEYQKIIFSMFKRAPGSPKNTQSGSGVGLTFAKKIIERHNGRMWLISTPHEGTTFYFTIGKK